MNGAGRGIRRIRHGASFRYADPGGRSITDAATLNRIKRLAIPPAWTDVWIATDVRAHLQATGRDARGRKQYRYHPRWHEVRHQAKYERLAAFGRALPALRRRVAADLACQPLTRLKVVAAVVRLLEKTLIRIGNVEYARANGSFGLTTLRDGHVRIRGKEVRFTFRGKSGVRQSITYADARLAAIVKRCQELPGQELFQYLDDYRRRRAVTSADVNRYLRDVMGAEFTAKDFRTWAGTLLAAATLRALAAPESARRVKSVVAGAVAEVARHLNNTPAVCRACYIHPAVLEAYADGTLTQTLSRARRRLPGLSAEETALLGLLEARRDWRKQLVEAARAA